MAGHYDVLGLTPTASTEEIKQAFRLRARLLHPDRHTAAPEDVQLEAQRVMAQLNEAYETLSDPQRRQAYDLGAFHTPSPDQNSRLRPPSNNECWLCGSSPAAHVTVVQNVGKVLWRERREVNSSLCRGCGREIVRAATNRTMLTGWWGVIAFFTNWTALYVNWRSWRSVRCLALPRRNRDVFAPLQGPIPEGRPLLGRAGVWVTSVIVLLVASAAVGQVENERAGTGGGPAFGIDNDQSLSEFQETFAGQCVTYDSTGQRIEAIIACGQPHDARILGVTATQELCPPATISYFTRPRGGVLCMDG